DAPVGGLRPSPSSAAETQMSLKDIEAVLERRLLVCQVPTSTEEEELSEVFGEFGKITDLKLVNGGKSQAGIAYIGFASWASVASAVTAVDGKCCLSCHEEGQTLAVSIAF
ncbi:unnamed protein product, partial [Polarella glacialis]